MAPYHHGKLRNALLDTAEDLVRERGAEGWSLREVSARVGVSPSAAYHHFSSRDALVRALSERLLARFGERIGRAVERASRADCDPQSTAHTQETVERAPEPDTDHQRRLVAVGRSYVGWAMEEPALARLAFGPGATGPETAISPHPHDVLAAELDRLVDVGGLAASARPGAEFVYWAAVHGLTVLLTDGLVRFDGERSVDREAERVVRAVLNGLEREATPAREWPTAHSAHTDRLAHGQAGRARTRRPAAEDG